MFCKSVDSNTHLQENYCNGTMRQHASKSLKEKNVTIDHLVTFDT